MTPGDIVRICGTSRTVELIHPLPKPRNDDVCKVETKGWCVMEEGGVFRYYLVDELDAKT